MIHLPLIASATLLLVAMLGVWLDLERVDVPYWASIAAVMLGAGVNFFLFGAKGLILAIAGVSVATVAYFVLHLLRMGSRGRLKLMAPVGAIVGPKNWLLICLFAVLLGVPIAIYVAFTTAHLQQTGATKGIIVRQFFHFLPPYHGKDELRVLRHNGAAMGDGALLAIAALFFLSLTAAWVSR